MHAEPHFREVLRMLLRGSSSLVQSAIADFTDQEWTSRPVPGCNPPGFSGWHAARTIDWAVNCGIRGVPEVASRLEFRSMAPELGIGTGISADEALAIARRMGRAEVGAYLTAVSDETLIWLESASDDELLQPNNLEANQRRFPVYSREGHLAEVRDLFELPNWHLILRPAGAHIRIHAGELETLREASRAEAGGGAN